MPDTNISRLKTVNNFESLVSYLYDELDWPITVEDADEITFDYEPKELGIEEQYAAKIRRIKQFRPLTENQPWGIFYIEFENKKLPVIVLRRILRALAHSRRTLNDRMKTWDPENLVFISSSGDIDERKISFAHFTESEKGLPELRTFSWDPSDTYFHYMQRKMDLGKLRWPFNTDDIETWHEKWSSAFILKHGEVIRTSKQLAIEMAHFSSQIREQVKAVFKLEVPNGPLHNLFNNFKKVLIIDLEINMFADMYAQTIAYGLFSAKATHEGEFEIKEISSIIPNTNPFLKSLFDECARIGDVDSENIDLEELGVTELIDMLKKTNMEEILADFGRQKKGEDPVIHFYELFLKEYDAEQKVKRGVFYTPDPIVSFIVRSVDHLLKTEFDCHDGMADISTIPIKYKRPAKKGGGYVDDIKHVPKVQILDPATGTGTFLKYTIEEIKKTFDKKYSDLSEKKLKEKWNEYVPKHLFPRVFGFEIMLAPYAVAHLKLGLKLKETGYDFKSEKRLGIYLTNALEGTHKGAGTLDAYFNWLADEVHKANVVKNKKISVIIGNPPYSVSSLNKNQYIERLMIDYKKGVKNEKNIQPLSDDYIKFIRYAHKIIDNNGFGIIAMITNNVYLSGIIHRGMRNELLKSFNKIFILDLHGNSRIGEKSPDGSEDKNVFDIQQGVSIIFLIKNNKFNKEHKINNFDLFGTRNLKYSFLNQKSLKDIKFQIIIPTEPYYFFSERITNSDSMYDNYLSVIDIFNEYECGVKTHRDSFVIGISDEDLFKRLKVFKSELSPEIIAEQLNLKNTNTWNLDNALEKTKENNLSDQIIDYYYRPFDMRKLCYNLDLIDRPRHKIMKHFFKKNLGIVTVRQLSSNLWKHILPTNKVGDICYVSLNSRESGYFFPLYIYNQNNPRINIKNKVIDLFSRKLHLKFLDEKKGNIKESFGPEDLFNYIIAILNSNNYRNQYNDYLKIDFPKIPITSDNILFYKLCCLGGNLVSIYLMRPLKIKINFSTLKGNGDYTIKSMGKKRYVENKIYINDIQYFDDIPEEIYNHQIGSYQVCQKWLKDRKGRKLTKEDIEHYQKIIGAIRETIKIMKEIDKTIDEHGGWPIK